MTRNWCRFVCALMLHLRARLLGHYCWRFATALTFELRRSHVQAEVPAWKSQKEPGKGLEVGRVVPKWIPGDDYCTPSSASRRRRDDLFVQTVKCRGSCASAARTP